MDFSFYTESIKVLGLLGNSTRLSIVCKLITYSERIGKRLHFKIKDNKTMKIIRVTKLILITFDINAFAIT